MKAAVLPMQKERRCGFSYITDHSGIPAVTERGMHMSEDYRAYALSQIIRDLESRNLGHFDITEDSGFSGIFAEIPEQEHSIYLIIESEHQVFTDEICSFAAEVLKNLDQAVKAAQGWLAHFNLKGDRRYPDALDAGYEISGIYIGSYEDGSAEAPRFMTDGFKITFTPRNCYPCSFTVKYHKNMVPFAVEEYVE